jgi:hypothetical protein
MHKACRITSLNDMDRRGRRQEHLISVSRWRNSSGNRYSDYPNSKPSLCDSLATLLHIKVKMMERAEGV